MKTTLAAVLLVWAFAGGASGNTIEYAVTDLGTLGGDESQAYGISENGQVVGWSFTNGDAARHAFLYTNGKMQGSRALAGCRTSVAVAVNDNGQVVGISYSLLPDNGFLYSGGAMTDFGGAVTIASGINDSGQVVGTAGNGHAFLYGSGKVQDIGPLGGNDSAANGINASGQVVGYSETTAGANHAFLYSNGKMQTRGPRRRREYSQRRQCERASGGLHRHKQWLQSRLSI